MISRDVRIYYLFTRAYIQLVSIFKATNVAQNVETTAESCGVNFPWGLNGRAKATQ